MHIELLRLWNLDNHHKTIIIITHDVEEAIFLSDSVVVMNNGLEETIKKIVNINLPRPRNKKDIAHDPEYIRNHDELLTLLFDKFSIEN